MTHDEFIKALRDINIDINDEQIQSLDKYQQLLKEWNEVMNLTGITEQNEVYLKHFYDSLTLVKIIDLNNVNSFCDIGTGAGFPGLVIKILFPKIEVHLVDSLQKRINFLNEVIKELKLDNIYTHHARAEEFSVKYPEKFDVVTARAVAPLNMLLEISLPAVKVSGFFIAMKANIKEEINESKNAFKKLNAELSLKVEFELPVEESKRTLIKIQKLASINKNYPRKFSEIKKNPL